MDRYGYILAAFTADKTLAAAVHCPDCDVYTVRSITHRTLNRFRDMKERYYEERRATYDVPLYDDEGLNYISEIVLLQAADWLYLVEHYGYLGKCGFNYECEKRGPIIWDSWHLDPWSRMFNRKALKRERRATR